MRFKIYYCLAAPLITQLDLKYAQRAAWLLTKTGSYAPSSACIFEALGKIPKFILVPNYTNE